MSTATTPGIDRVVDGRYRVDRLLATGGMAAVYAATDLRLDRQVALKVMHADLARDAQFVARFEREARSAAALSHPNVVGVYDQGEDGDLVFLAMELVPGRTMREVITDDAPLSVQEAVALMDPVLAALAAAHEADLVHRDVKPENVLISPTGAVKVADFGLARAITASTVSRSTDLTWGTAAYLSPEQVERGSADARSDVYAAALLLFELLTGEKAFPGSSPIQVAYAHVHGAIPQASALCPSVPAEVDALIQWAGATDPSRRPADAGEFRRGMHTAIAQLSEEELSATPGEQVEVDEDLTQAFGVRTSSAATTAFGATAPIRAQHTRAVPAVTARHYARTTGNRPARAPKPSRPRPRRRGRRIAGWTLGLLLVLIAAGGAGATWYYTAGPGIHSPVPTLVGLTEAQARGELAGADLGAVVDTTYSEEIEADVVISASHQPGTMLRHGTDVELLVSLGPERYAVPDLVGRTVEEARELVEEANLELGEVTEVFDEQAPAGEVLSSTPATGEPVRPGTLVEVVVSQGREPIEVPAVVGRSLDEAEETLTNAGFQVRVEPDRVFHDEIPEGSVVSQSPADGTGFRGDEVALVLSRGPDLVEVPRLIGMQWDTAEELLSDLGFEVLREEIAGGYFNTVRFQSYDPGEMVRRGSEITLTVL